MLFWPKKLTKHRKRAYNSAIAPSDSFCPPSIAFLPAGFLLFIHISLLLSKPRNCHDYLCASRESPTSSASAAGTATTSTTQTAEQARLHAIEERYPSKEIARVELELLREKQRVEIGTKIYIYIRPRARPQNKQFFLLRFHQHGANHAYHQGSFRSVPKANPNYKAKKSKGQSTFSNRKELQAKKRRYFRANGVSQPNRL